MQWFFSPSVSRFCLSKGDVSWFKLTKLVKFPRAKDAEGDYERRLRDLRMYIAKTAYMDTYQGRYTGKNFRWTRDPQTTWDN